MTDITSWLRSGDPPTLDSLLDLSDTFGHTENHAIQNMDLSWLDNETFIDGFSLFDECISSNPIGTDEYAIQTQSELVPSKVLQEPIFPGFGSLPEVFVGESHNLILPGAGPQFTTNSDVDQTTTNEQRKKRPGSPTSHSPQPRKKSGVAFSRSSKHRAKLCPSSKKALEDFFKDNIYPESNDVARLAEQTGVEKQQIKTWFRNQRARKLNVNISSGPEDIPELPCGPSDQTFATALADIPRIDPKSLMERYLGVPLDQDNRMPTMATPVNEKGGNQAPAGSDSSWSSCGSQNSWSSRRGRRKVVKHGKTGQYDLVSDPFKFRCTFCGGSFKDRYQWRRHEETKHAPRTGWICKDTVCANKPIEDSIFFREDLFTQHRTKHATPGSPEARGCSQHTSTKFEIVLAKPIPQAHPALQCGFCGERLSDWADRVNHIAAHFEKGANFSSWWLRRAEFIAITKAPPKPWTNNDLKAALPHSVFCVYCKRLYLTLDEAQARHPECVVWSCGLFEGILTAYEKLTMSDYPVWVCIYCDDQIWEIGPDHSKRLRHLVMKHNYRSCHPRIFLDLSTFQYHLAYYHNSRVGGTATLESTCRLAKKSRFRSAMVVSSIQRAQVDLAPYFTGLPPFINVDIIGRSHDRDLCITATSACFDVMSPHNVISLAALEPLQSGTDLQIVESEDDVLVDTPRSHVGHVVIQWVGRWGDKWGIDFLRPAPRVYVTKFFVRDYGLSRTLLFGRPAMEEINMVRKYLPPV